MKCKYCNEKIIKGDNHTNIKNICIECCEANNENETSYNNEYISYYED